MYKSNTHTRAHTHTHTHTHKKKKKKKKALIYKKKDPWGCWSDWIMNLADVVTGQKSLIDWADGTSWPKQLQALNTLTKVTVKNFLALMRVH